MRIGLTEYSDSPTLQVMTMAEAKLHLRVDFNDDDALISALIDAATLQAEAFCNAAFTPRNFLMTMGAWPQLGAGSFGPDEDGAEFPSRFGGSGRPSRWPMAIAFPIHPVTSVSSIAYLESAAGVVTTLSTSAYTLVSSTRPGFIVPAQGQVWPSLYSHPEAVRVAFRAGFESCPANAVAAIKLLMGHLYAHREEVTPGVGAPDPVQIPLGAKYLLGPHRMFPL